MKVGGASQGLIYFKQWGESALKLLVWAGALNTGLSNSSQALEIGLGLVCDA